MEHSVGLLLLTMIGGYWVLERASGQKGQLRQVGFFVGSVVIVVSLLGVGLKVWWISTNALSPHRGMMMDKMGMMDHGDRMGGKMGRHSMMPSHEQEVPGKSAEPSRQ